MGEWLFFWIFNALEIVEFKISILGNLFLVGSPSIQSAYGVGKYGDCSMRIHFPVEPFFRIVLGISQQGNLNCT